MGADRSLARLDAAAASCPSATDTALAPKQEIGQMRCVIAEVRAQDGLPRLRVSQKLDAAASIKATAIRRCGFTHTPCGQPWALPLQRVGYLRRASTVGENLAWGQSEQGSPLQVVNEWLASPPHRRNLLDRSYREAGLALQRGSMFGDGDVTLWVLEFGRRR